MILTHQDEHADHQHEQPRWIHDVVDDAIQPPYRVIMDRAHDGCGDDEGTDEHGGRECGIVPFHTLVQKEESAERGGNGKQEEQSEEPRQRVDLSAGFEMQYRQRVFQKVLESCDGATRCTPGEFSQDGAGRRGGPICHKQHVQCSSNTVCQKVGIEILRPQFMECDILVVGVIAKDGNDNFSQNDERCCDDLRSGRRFTDGGIREEDDPNQSEAGERCKY
mmetsp:Transcript_16219/g.44949  ORF Transcript_16219/g.44949 Transcript_16219/m.44949 type:complete len:221 (+) Transcript_16219:370-1032(+)